MTGRIERRRIWGWFFFDWASQPYNTLLLTFIFGPYVKTLLGDGAAAQASWGYAIAAAGFVIALLAPVLGALADGRGNRMLWIWAFSLLYVIGASGLWWARPGDFDLTLVMISFAIGLIGMEFATIFTNAMLPDLGPREQIGRISGNGWAFGYLGGLVSLVLMLLLFAEDAETGRTLIGIEPLFGLDAAAREGTRFVGPFSALWYILFMIPFFAWMRDPAPARRAGIPVRRALAGLVQTVRRLPRRRSEFAFLGASMLYRDALNGTYALGAIFAAGVLDWSVVQTGTFGILAVITGAVFAWIGGRADTALGPRPVIIASILALIAVVTVSVFVSRESLFGMALAPGSALPDIVFYAVGAVIGAAGGALQSASRSMMVRQGDPARMTEAFGLYALSGKATAFIAPLSIAVATDLSGSQQLGIIPLIALFASGLFLLSWVKPDGDRAA
ncbi:MFS transporter [Profundibacterium mesophilum]|uniref:Major facilitator superfamily transporter n=1 Tax=Profundibacterium mesophilum KAUST100406-0324 TaxID=1037889 RepID=A0A921TDN6_9RHOB|nr:MFS transporter [Profundibacterium mesophilum]KAF0676407.1 Major facilitator superfamily transporter [Profundibacterium mesophilum KAUST100406-0324]